MRALLSLVFALLAPALAAAATPPSTAAALAPAAPTANATTASPPAPKTRALRIAVLDLAAEGIEPRVAAVVVESLLVELRKLARTSVLSMDEVRAMLDVESQKQLLGCDASSCVQEIADALGADVLISGGIARVADESVLTLKRIEPATAAVTKTFSRRLTPAGGEEFLAALGPATEELFPDVPLRPGLVRGVAPEVALLLNPPPLPRAVFVGSAVATGVALAGAGVAAGFFVANQAAYDAYADLGLVEDIEGVTLREKRTSTEQASLAAWVFVGAAGVFALATGVIAPFTDWNDAQAGVGP